MKNIKLKVSLYQTFALVFLIASVQRFYIAIHAEKYKAFLASDWDRYDSLSSSTEGELLYHERLLGLGAFLLGILLLGYVNWKNKIPRINIGLTFTLVLLLYSIGFFSRGTIKLFIDAFWESMALNYGLAYLIAGVVMGLISLTFVVTSLKKK